MDTKYEFISRELTVSGPSLFNVPDDYQLIGIANGDGAPLIVWVRMPPALDTQLEMDLNGADASDYPE